MADSRRIGEFDGLRGVSIALVLLFHYFLQHVVTTPGSLAAYAVKYLSLAWAGVDVFFVLSGFLLGGILLDQRGAKNFFKAFYLRRAFRIVPPYLLFLLLFAFALQALPVTAYSGAGWLLADPLPFWSYVLYLQNLFMAYRGGFGANFGAPTWSLAVEEQFYLLFPALIYFCPPARLGRVLVLLAFAAPVLRIVLYFSLPNGAVAGFVLLPSRGDALLLGAFAAWALRQEAWRLWIVTHAKGLSRVLGIAVAAIGLFPVLGFHQFTLAMAAVGQLWIAVAVALMLALLTEQKLSGVARVLRGRPFAFLGRISYSVYLFHLPVYGCLSIAVFEHEPRIASLAELALALAALAFTLLLATATWYGFESRLIRMGHATPYRVETSR